jgi:putative Mn2+ efflux pump MntP
MATLTVGLMSVGLAADAVAVSLTSGLLIQRIQINKALKIALFFGSFQMLMPVIGWLVGLSIRELISMIAPWVAFIILAGLGLKMIKDALTEEEEKPFNPLDNVTLFGLAIATSIDALFAGLGLSVIKMSLPLIVTAIGLVTFILCFLGVLIGHRFGNLFQDKVEVVGGLMLIALGAKILIEALI